MCTPKTVLLAKPGVRSVEAVALDNGRCPAEDFLDEIEALREGPKSKPNSSAKARFLFLFQQMSDYGQISPKRFYSEMGDFWTFAHEVKNVQIRFPCFRDGNKWIVTHGFKKPGAQKGLGKWPESEVKRAEELMALYKRQCAICRKGGKS
jgi:Phage derived protein Gp49-like (DUF891)